MAFKLRLDHPYGRLNRKLWIHLRLNELDLFARHGLQVPQNYLVVFRIYDMSKRERSSSPADNATPENYREAFQVS
jgi:hypothetical protein